LNRTTSIFDVASRAVATINALGKKVDEHIRRGKQHACGGRSIIERTTSIYDVANRRIGFKNALGNRFTTITRRLQSNHRVGRSSIESNDILVLTGASQQIKVKDANGKIREVNRTRLGVAVPDPLSSVGTGTSSSHNQTGVYLRV